MVHTVMTAAWLALHLVCVPLLVTADVPDALAQLLRNHKPTVDEADAFWALAQTETRLTYLPSDENLPPLPGDHRSVAVCMAGGARTFPLLDNGIAHSIKEKVG